MAEHILIAGKAGVGKSTTAANLAAALAAAGHQVALIGYDSRWNSTATLRGTSELKPLPAWRGGDVVPFYTIGFKGALCIEAGELIVEGEAAKAALLLQHPTVVVHRPEYVIHDLAWEPDSSFGLPSAIEGIVRLYVVTSADMAAIQVVNELFVWLNTVSSIDCRFGGVVVNNLRGPFYESIIADFVSKTGTSVVVSVPHSLMVSVSDFYNQTLIESAPLSHNSFVYRKLARQVSEQTVVPRPTFLDCWELKHWAKKWGEIIAELETGVVADGSHI